MHNLSTTAASSSLSFSASPAAAGSGVSRDSPVKQSTHVAANAQVNTTSHTQINAPAHAQVNTQVSSAATPAVPHIRTSLSALTAPLFAEHGHLASRPATRGRTNPSTAATNSQLTSQSHSGSGAGSVSASALNSNSASLSGAAVAASAKGASTLARTKRNLNSQAQVYVGIGYTTSDVSVTNILAPTTNAANQSTKAHTATANSTIATHNLAQSSVATQSVGQNPSHTSHTSGQADSVRDNAQDGRKAHGMLGAPEANFAKAQTANAQNAMGGSVSQASDISYEQFVEELEALIHEYETISELVDESLDNVEDLLLLKPDFDELNLRYAELQTTWQKLKDTQCQPHFAAIRDKVGLLQDFKNALQVKMQLTEPQAPSQEVAYGSKVSEVTEISDGSNGSKGNQASTAPQSIQAQQNSKDGSVNLESAGESTSQSAQTRARRDVMANASLSAAATATTSTASVTATKPEILGEQGTVRNATVQAIPSATDSAHPSALSQNQPSHTQSQPATALGATPVQGQTLVQPVVTLQSQVKFQLKVQAKSQAKSQDQSQVHSQDHAQAQSQLATLPGSASRSAVNSDFVFGSAAKVDSNQASDPQSTAATVVTVANKGSAPSDSNAQHDMIVQVASDHVAAAHVTAEQTALAQTALSQTQSGATQAQFAPAQNQVAPTQGSAAMAHTAQSAAEAHENQTTNANHVANAANATHVTHATQANHDVNAKGPATKIASVNGGPNATNENGVKGTHEGQPHSQSTPQSKQDGLVNLTPFTLDWESRLKVQAQYTAKSHELTRQQGINHELRETNSELSNSILEYKKLLEGLKKQYEQVQQALEQEQAEHKLALLHLNSQLSALTHKNAKLEQAYAQLEVDPEVLLNTLQENQKLQEQVEQANYFSQLTYGLNEELQKRLRQQINVTLSLTQESDRSINAISRMNTLAPVASTYSGCMYLRCYDSPRLIALDLKRLAYLEKNSPLTITLTKSASAMSFASSVASADSGTLTAGEDVEAGDAMGKSTDAAGATEAKGTTDNASRASGSAKGTTRASRAKNAEHTPGEMVSLEQIAFTDLALQAERKSYGMQCDEDVLVDEDDLAYQQRSAGISTGISEHSKAKSAAKIKAGSKDKAGSAVAVGAKDKVESKDEVEAASAPFVPGASSKTGKKPGQAAPKKGQGQGVYETLAQELEQDDIDEYHYADEDYKTIGDYGETHWDSDEEADDENDEMEYASTLESLEDATKPGAGTLRVVYKERKSNKHAAKPEMLLSYDEMVHHVSQNLQSLGWAAGSAIEIAQVMTTCYLKCIPMVSGVDTQLLSQAALSLCGNTKLSAPYLQTHLACTVWQLNLEQCSPEQLARTLSLINSPVLVVSGACETFSGYIFKTFLQLLKSFTQFKLVLFDAEGISRESLSSIWWDNAFYIDAAWNKSQLSELKSLEELPVGCVLTKLDQDDYAWQFNQSSASTQWLDAISGAATNFKLRHFMTVNHRFSLNSVYNHLFWVQVWGQAYAAGKLQQLKTISEALGLDWNVLLRPHNLS